MVQIIIATKDKLNSGVIDRILKPNNSYSFQFCINQSKSMQNSTTASKILRSQ